MFFDISPLHHWVVDHCHYFRSRGAVINANGATVGALVGDGCVLSFSDPQHITYFDICLLIATSQDNATTSTYPVADYGYLSEDMSVIRPLGIASEDISEKTIAESLFWCVRLNLHSLPQGVDGTVKLFPISRLENYETETEEPVSKTTKVLMYFLGVCFSILGLMYIFIWVSPYHIP